MAESGTAPATQLTPFKTTSATTTNSNWKKYLPTFTGWVTKHRTGTVLLGAFIVFVSFVVKDQYRERYKDLVGSIDNAEDIFHIRRDIREIQDELQDFHYAVEKTTSYGQNTGHSRLNQLLPRVRVVKLGLKGTALLVDNIARLSEKMGNSPLDSAAIAAVQARLKELNTSIDVSEKRLAYGKDNEFSTLDSDIYNLWLEMYLLDQKAVNLATSIVLEADTLKNKEEKAYKMLSLGSNCLFGIGWILGLAGKLLTIDTGV